MTEAAYLYLLIFCGCLMSQGIIASLSEKNTRKSLDFLVRNKRVINHEPGGYNIARFKDINYIVSIRFRGRNHCVGAILSHFTVITAAPCVAFHISEYLLQSGSGYSHRSKIHNATSKVEHYGNPPHEPYDGIALIKVDPPFTFGANIGIIELHVEPILTGTPALVSGWGCQHPTSPPMVGKNRLRSITLPIMNQRECVARYEGVFKITNKYICTYDERKLCGLTDRGTPLVIDNMLIGIHIYKGEFQHRINPDVFLDVQNPEYSVWIRQNIIH